MGVGFEARETPLLDPDPDPDPQGNTDTGGLRPLAESSGFASSIGAALSDMLERSLLPGTKGGGGRGGGGGGGGALSDLPVAGPAPTGDLLSLASEPSSSSAPSIAASSSASSLAASAADAASQSATKSSDWLAGIAGPIRASRQRQGDDTGSVADYGVQDRTNTGWTWSKEDTSTPTVDAATRIMSELSFRSNRENRRNSGSDGGEAYTHVPGWATGALQRYNSTTTTTTSSSTTTTATSTTTTTTTTSSILDHSISDDVFSMEAVDPNYELENGNISSYFANFSECIWNGTSCNETFTEAPDEDPGQRFWAMFLLIFPLLTVFGNVLVCLSVYKERSLRTVTNYFIVSLAIADIMVAVLVMPLAVYVEVNYGNWYLGEGLCDTWVAMDVMCCTASILNLTAISVDRFIAVTQPIKYAQHKNSNRVYIMLALTWIVSLSISSPIALGMNYTEMRRKTPQLCIFYNSDFLIYSSMGSFYIPCVIMILLYWRIFRAIQLRARKAASHKKWRPVKTTQNTAPTVADGRTVIENKAQTMTNRTTSEASATEDNSQKELLPAGNSIKTAAMRKPIAEETSFTNFNATLTTDTTGDESHNDISRCPTSCVDNAHVIPNDKSAEFNLLSPVSDDSHADFPRDHDSGYSAPTTVEVKQKARASASGGVASPPKLLSPPTRLAGLRNHSPRFPRRNRGGSGSSSGAANGDYKDESPKKSVTKFNFHLRHSKKKKERLSSRRERKATKTLAIVLGVFLFCWVPFFTINIMNAVCIRYDLFDRPECNLEPMLFSFFVWLGYINSFLNPVIYTIFNVEFRKAFKKLLLQPCK